MFCRYCGGEIKEDADICPYCGQKVDGAVLEAETVNNEEKSRDPKDTVVKAEPEIENKQKAEENASKPKGKKKRGFPLIPVVIIAVVLFVLFSGNDDSKYIDMVKGGSPIGFPEATYEEVFNNFFSNPKWDYIKAESGADVVEFNGGCTYLDAPANMCMQFTLSSEGDTFDLTYLDINGEPQNVLMSSLYLNKIFEEYKSGETGTLYLDETE